VSRDEPTLAAPRLAILREHAQGKHTIVRIDCPACRKFGVPA
jgi:hypothetical protein